MKDSMYCIIQQKDLFIFLVSINNGSLFELVDNRERESIIDRQIDLLNVKHLDKENRKMKIEYCGSFFIYEMRTVIFRSRVQTTLPVILDVISRTCTEILASNYKRKSMNQFTIASPVERVSRNWCSLLKFRACLAIVIRLTFDVDI